MSKFYVDVYLVCTRESQSASGFWLIGGADVADCPGLIPQVLRDALRLASESTATCVSALSN